MTIQDFMSITHSIQSPLSTFFYANVTVTPKKRRGNMFGFAGCLAFSEHQDQQKPSCLILLKTVKSTPHFSWE
jgi:hypothetical protein